MTREAFSVAAAPVITGAPQYRQSAPMSAGEIAFVLAGCAAILLFGAVLMWLWNRWNAH